MPVDGVDLPGVAVVEVDPHDDRLLRAWHDAFRDGASAGREAPLVTAYAELAASLRDPGQRLRRLPYAALEGGRVVGALLLELRLRDNRHLAELEIDVPPEHRGRGVGAALFARADAVARAEGRTTYLCELHVPTGAHLEQEPGPRFALRRGFASAHCEDHLVRGLPVDEALLADIGARSAERDAGYRYLAWTGGCPDEHLEAYADLRSAMERDVPIGQLDYEPPTWTADIVRTDDRRRAATGFTQLVVVAADPAGAFVGYSLLLVPAHQPDEVLQEDTLVLRGHRGHRLGAALKAGNLRALSALFPARRRLHTWTARDNHAMQAVNRAFGFRAVEELHEFQLVR